MASIVKWNLKSLHFVLHPDCDASYMNLQVLKCMEHTSEEINFTI